jgi:hypothetical protein
MKSTLKVAGVLVVASSCAVADEVGIETNALVSNCGDLACGNAGKLLDRTLVELDSSMTDFSPVGGLRITRVIHPVGGDDYELRVFGYEPVALSTIPGGPNFTRIGLLNTRIELESDTGQKFVMTVKAYGEIPFYENAQDGSESIPALMFEYTVVGGGSQTPPEPVCPTGTTSHLDRHAILFEGDRYDPATGEITATGGDADPWFNVACNDTAIWKAHLFGYTEAAQDKWHDSTEDERMAVLRSIIMDACGDGESHTELGTAVDWADRDGMLYFNNPDWVIEAVWNRDGAVCLTHPRFEEVECANRKPIPRCSKSQIVGWPSRSHVKTRVPPPP